MKDDGKFKLFRTNDRNVQAEKPRLQHYDMKLTSTRGPSRWTQARSQVARFGASTVPECPRGYGMDNVTVDHNNSF